jgi:hypothetical protein
MCEVIPLRVNGKVVASHPIEVLDGNAGLCPSAFPFIVGFTGDDLATLLAALWCYQSAEYPWVCTQSETALDAIAFNFQSLDDANDFIDAFSERTCRPLG